MYLVAGYILCVVDSVTISVTGATLWGGGGGGCKYVENYVKNLFKKSTVG